MRLQTFQDLTGLLKALASGNLSALEQLTPFIYTQLLRIARRHMRQQPPQTSDYSAGA
ncbi:MAG: hypothetical protein JO058_04425 [Alphaproteobacteria bacterium]|nr:hypothetical protein [Alphaproteobacteria bacterium]